MHRDPRWFPDPLAFRPERWEDGLQKKLPKFAYMPFGGGARICIGNQFALMELALSLATIAQRFFLRTEPGHRVVPEPAITLRFKHGLRMTLTKRDPS
jgi:cytochrome P450